MFSLPHFEVVTVVRLEARMLVTSCVHTLTLPFVGGGGGFRIPPQAFVCHCQTAGDKKLELPDV